MLFESRKMKINGWFETKNDGKMKPHSIIDTPELKVITINNFKLMSTKFSSKANEMQSFWNFLSLG